MNKTKYFLREILKLIDGEAIENFDNLSIAEQLTLVDTVEYLKKLKTELIKRGAILTEKEKNKIEFQIASCRRTISNINNIKCIESYYKAIEISIDILLESAKIAVIMLLNDGAGDNILSIDILNIVKKING